MPMAKSVGNLPPPNPEDPKRCFDLPTTDPREVKQATVQLSTSPSQALDLEKYVARSASAVGTVDADSAANAKLLEYIEGSIITVTFFTQLPSDSYGRSTYNSFSESVDPIHQHYRKINNFQMKLVDPNQFKYQAENTQSGVTGEAILYPYFCPYQGDMFIYETGTNKLGVFKITEPPQRLSIMSTTCHSIRFSLITWLTDEFLAKLNACVVNEAYFNLETWMNTHGSFLQSDTAKMLEDTKKAIATLTHYYVSEYLETKIYRTFIENACLYDPYLVEFCRTLFESEDLPFYPVQLLPNPPHWKESFWAVLLDPDYTPESIMITTALRVNYDVNNRTVGVTALTNRCYIELQDRDVYKGHVYPPMTWPKTFDPEDTTLPMQVRLYLSTRQVYPYALLLLAKEMLLAHRIAGFYYIPILIFLLKKLLAALNSGNANLIYQKDDEGDKNNVGCNGDCDDCIFNCHPPHLRYVTKCPGHSRHSCSFSNDCNSIYVPPCGGCNSDPHIVPEIWKIGRACPPPDIRYAPTQRQGWVTGTIPYPPRVPEYGPPKVPIPLYQKPRPPRPKPPKPCCPPPCPPPPPPPEWPPSPYDNPPHPDPKGQKLFLVNRPSNKSGYLHLVAEISPTLEFTDPMVLLDTRVNSDETIASFVGRSALAGFDGTNFYDLDENGIPEEAPMVTIRVELPVRYLRYKLRYQWIDSDGTELGWVVLNWH